MVWSKLARDKARESRIANRGGLLSEEQKIENNRILCNKRYLRHKREIGGNSTEEERAKNREKARKWRLRPGSSEKTKRRWLLKVYGITLEQMNELFKSGCEICGSFRRLVIDHNHGSGKIRGCLCSTCNAFVGHVGDGLDENRLVKVVEYLGFRLVKERTR